MLERWIISIAISFVMRQISKFQKGIDWPKVKADLAVRVRSLVPGTWLDAEAVAVCNAVVDAAAAVLAAQAELEKILKLLSEENYDQAWNVLRDLIVAQWQPRSAAEKKVMKAVEAL